MPQRGKQIGIWRSAAFPYTQLPFTVYTGCISLVVIPWEPQVFVNLKVTE